MSVVMYAHRSTNTQLLACKMLNELPFFFLLVFVLFNCCVVCRFLHACCSDGVVSTDQWCGSIVCYAILKKKKEINGKHISMIVLVQINGEFVQVGSYLNSELLANKQYWQMSLIHVLDKINYSI